MLQLSRLRQELRARLLLGTFALAVVLLGLFFRLGALPFIGADEPRYARISQEMLESRDYLTPHLQGRPWFEKPPLLFWLQAASFRLLGVGELQARLPVALTALGGSLMLAWLVVRTMGPAAGFLAFLVLQTSVLYLLFGRSGSTDMPLTAWLTVALAAVFLAQHERSSGWAALAGAALAAAVLAKGPVALALSAMVIFFWAFVTDRFPWTWRQWGMAGASFLALAVPWFAWVWLKHGENFGLTFWVNHHLARYATDLHHHRQPLWYYIPIVMAGFFPWVIFLGSSARSTWNMRRLDRVDSSLRCYLWIWAVVPLVFFSLSGSKLAGYILPAIPPLAALVALEWDRIHQRDLGAYRSMRTQLALLGSLAVLLALVLIFGFHFRYGALTTGFVVALPLLASVLWGRIEYSRRRPGSLFLLLVGGTTVTAALLYAQATSVVAQYHSAHELALSAVPRISSQQPLVLYRFFHHSAQYYTGYRTTRQALSSPAELMRYVERHPQRQYILLTKQEGKDELEGLGRLRLLQSAGDLYLVELTFGQP
jgi:4-amino-4-deoxy-L-arabinose transferase-like glycosyltransferase